MMIAYKAGSNFAFLSLIFAAYMEWIRSPCINFISSPNYWIHGTVTKVAHKAGTSFAFRPLIFAAKMTWIITNISFSVIYQILSP